MIYMTRIQNMSFFLFKVNNPSVRYLVWPRLAPIGHPVRPCLAPIGHPVRPCLAPIWPRLAPIGHPVRPYLAPVWPSSGTSIWPPSGPPSSPICPSVWPSIWPLVWLLRPASSGPLFGQSQGYKFAQICITLYPSCIASLKTLASLLWIHYVRPIVQGGFNFPILDYYDLQDHMHDQFHASTFFSSSI
jgi:hypothetical protein